MNKKILTHKGISIYHSQHSEERFEERNVSNEFFTYICTQAIEVKNKVVKSNEYMIFSKKYFQAIVVKILDQKSLLVKTILPKGKSIPKPGTPKIIVERFYTDIKKYSQQFINYINFLLKNKITKEYLKYNWNPIEIEDNFVIVLDKNKLELIEFENEILQIIEVE